MAKKMYVGNLSYSANEEELRRIFEEHGTVVSAQVIMDRETGRSKGFAFVEMSSDQEAQAAISALDGKEIGGRVLKVNEARPREDRGGRRRRWTGSRRLRRRRRPRPLLSEVAHLARVARAARAGSRTGPLLEQCQPRISRCASRRSGDRNRRSTCGCGVLRGTWGSACATGRSAKGLLVLVFDSVCRLTALSFVMRRPSACSCAH